MKNGKSNTTVALRFPRTKRSTPKDSDDQSTAAIPAAPFETDGLPATDTSAQATECRLRTPFSRFVKRTVDLTVSIPVVCLALPALCVAVRVGQLAQSSGPLFYRQKRCGQHGAEFTILKFRTMNVPTEGQSEESEQIESRIFPIGGFLRRSKLDEIPQFVNVLLGSMSVVGPRPHHYEDCEQFEAAVQDYAQRTIAKPGITGLAQYLEFNGEFAWNCTQSRVRQDLRYIREWTLSLDMQLIARTAGAIARRACVAALRRLRSRNRTEPVVAVKFGVHRSADRQLSDLSPPTKAAPSKKAA